MVYKDSIRHPFSSLFMLCSIVDAPAFAAVGGLFFLYCLKGSIHIVFLLFDAKRRCNYSSHLKTKT